MKKNVIILLLAVTIPVWFIPFTLWIIARLAYEIIHEILFEEVE